MKKLLITLSLIAFVATPAAFANEGKAKGTCNKDKAAACDKAQKKACDKSKVAAKSSCKTACSKSAAKETAANTKR